MFLAPEQGAVYQSGQTLSVQWAGTVDGTVDVFLKRQRPCTAPCSSTCPPPLTPVRSRRRVGPQGDSRGQGAVAEDPDRQLIRPRQQLLCALFSARPRGCVRVTAL